MNKENVGSVVKAFGAAIIAAGVMVAPLAATVYFAKKNDQPRHIYTGSSLLNQDDITIKRTFRFLGLTPHH